MILIQLRSHQVSPLKFNQKQSNRPFGYRNILISLWTCHFQADLSKEGLGLKKLNGYNNLWHSWGGLSS